MSFLENFNPFRNVNGKAVAQKGVGGVVTGVIAAAKFAGKAQAMLEAVQEDTDGDQIPEYQNALNLILECVERVKTSTWPLLQKAYGHLVEIKNDCATELKFHSERISKAGKIVFDLFIHTMQAEKATQVALLAPPTEESQSA